MKTELLDVLFEHYLENENGRSAEEKELYHEVLQYVNEEQYDEAEGALNCYGGICEKNAFKQGFVTAYRLFQEMIGLTSAKQAEK